MARILIIDDEESIRKLLAKALLAYGHEVFQAGGGKEGILRCSQTPIDLVITDIIMPEGEGLETILQLKQSHPELKIFAISGGSLSLHMDVLSCAAHFGAIRTFEKPFSLDDIIAAIDGEMLSANNPQIT